MVLPWQGQRSVPTPSRATLRFSNRKGLNPVQRIGDYFRRDEMNACVGYCEDKCLVSPVLKLL